MNLPVGESRSAPTARPQCSLVLGNTITFALQEWRWSRVGLPISASASWSAGSPLPLSQAGQSFAYGSFPLPSELSASLRQRLLRLELTPDVARRTAKAVEDYLHSKTLTRLPSPSRFFALCHHLAIRTGHCYSLLGQRPRSLSHNGLGLKARNRSRSMHCDRPTAWGASFAKVLGRCPTAIKLSLEALVTRARSQAPAWECSIPRRLQPPAGPPKARRTGEEREAGASRTGAFPGWSLGTRPRIP